MWCPNCNSDSPLVALSHSGLICAACHAEVLERCPEPHAHDPHTARSKAPVAGIAIARNASQSPTADSLAASNFSVTSPHRRGVKPRLIDRDGHAAATRSSNATQVSESTPLTNSGQLTTLPTTQPLFRFDPPHAPRRERQETELPTIQQQTQSPKNSTASGDSPSSLLLIVLFFAGQFLVVWAFQQQNVNGLGLGMILSVAAVGIGLQAGLWGSSTGDNQRQSRRGAATPTTTTEVPTAEPPLDSAASPTHRVPTSAAAPLRKTRRPTSPLPRSRG